MNLSHYYWYFTSALSPKFCDEVIKYASSKKDKFALTGSLGRHRDVDKKPLSQQEEEMVRSKRNSNIVWLDQAWIYKELQPYVHKANLNAGWNFQWNRTESVQFTKYNINQYYDWHCDSWEKPYKNGEVRKLSMTCQLTDGSEYEGGELEFDFRNYEPYERDESKHLIRVKEVLPKGSIIIFPSFVWHRVKPVKKGVRHSLVAWNNGASFK